MSRDASQPAQVTMIALVFAQNAAVSGEGCTGMSPCHQERRANLTEDRGRRGQERNLVPRRSGFGLSVTAPLAVEPGPMRLARTRSWRVDASYQFFSGAPTLAQEFQREVIQGIGNLSGAALWT